ncbi:Imm43 family immunity protein [Flavobacterium ginsengiterrae]|uniref:Immunity protein 43 domain-containing protein n=1 Tax=Flavobacterium ginsengiterrae TaxID=871695 RepID=A0ABP7GL85_9FLAO
MTKCNQIHLQKLWLISKDRLYSFDFRQAFNGYIVSERLLSLMDDFEVKNWEKCKLNVVINP